METTKELWCRNHPSRKQLPKNFEDSISIKFFELGKGSTTIPLMRELRFEDDELPLIIEDELDKAAVIIEASIEAAAQDRPMPENLPRLVLPQFAQFGKTLAEEDSIFARARKRATEVRYTSKVRQRIISFLEPVYEDVIDITGEVRLADLDGCNFALRKDDGRKVPGKFDPEQEALITEALRDHATSRLRVRGVAEFSRPDGALKRIVRIEDIHPSHPGEPQYDPSVKPVWEVVAEIGAQVSEDEWTKVPTDLSKNLDHYLYGAPKE